ncbi:MAG TPA: chromate resistance protein ChrB domain-containing protein [Thermoanaerobaculia bacterium]|nr:chromate resistance protein ChrB domain-containing protein [Thermoanaerobaculia bacterium]
MSEPGRKARNWLLLVHSVPAEPLYLRAKVRRLLDHAGAIALKKAVYALPPGDSSREAMERVAGEAASGGGHGYVAECTFVDPRTDDLLIESSRSARRADYDALAESLRGLESDASPEAVARARQRFEAIRRIDFFDAPGRRRVESLLSRLERASAVGRDESASRGGLSELVGRVWATRRGVQIDRIASAWLIRRFIDPDAEFRFIDPKEERRKDELRFDMVGGDFTHEGDGCTFETLVRTVGTPDPALRQVAEIVHDVDIKDGKFGRADAPGIQQVVLGIVLHSSDDEERLRRGFALFDDLYASFRSRNPVTREVSS